MSNRTKKILKITTVVLVVIFTGLLIYNLFFKKKPPTPPVITDEEVIISDEFGPETKERLIPLTEEAVLGAGLKNNTGLIYVAWDGQIKTIDFNGGSREKIGSAPGERISEVKISANGGLVGLKQTLPSGAARSVIFDSENKNIRSLPQNTGEMSFGPEGKTIVLALAETGGSALTILDLTNSKQTRLAATPIPDLILEWFSPNAVGLKTKPSGLAYGLMYVLDTKTKKISRLIGSTYGLTASFSPSGKRILYTKTDSSGTNLELKALNTDKKTETNLNILSLPEKCAWSQDNRTLFCGAIKTEDDPVMPDDYYKDKIEAAGEDIVRINLDNGQTQKLIGGVFDVYRPFLSPNEDYLFFTNKKDGRLYRLTL
ncbi:MAG: hypothetical protein HYV54_00645 [Parcubacteria group bacterium]|nr:hypothetical protein [Parcubacteria group bacterium]